MTKSLLPSLYKERNYPSLAKRGEGRFSEQYVFSITDSSVNPHYKAVEVFPACLPQCNNERHPHFNLNETPFQNAAKDS